MTGYRVRASMFAVALAAGVGVGVSAASADVYTINWLDMSSGSPQGSILTGGSVLPGNTFNLPGYGSVQVVYANEPSIPTRNSNAALNNGSITSGGDTYSWTGVPDQMLAVNFSSTPTVSNWVVSYNFLDGPISAGQLAFATFGIGRFLVSGTEYISTVSAAQNATFLGDFDLPGATAPTQFSSGFSLMNSQPSLGVSGEASFNTDFGIVRIDDAVTSLTVSISQIGQDGLGMTIGYIVPGPGATGLLAIAGLSLRRRRR
jgi:hypothetical protein